jgi:amino acid adenylation domain-containing protein
MQAQMSAAYELSPQQRQIFTRHREKDAIGIAILVEGKADVTKIRDAIESVVSRHEILRTRFQRRTGMRFPFQVVSEDVQFPWVEVDLTQFSVDEQELRIKQTLEGRSKINIETGPVLSSAWADIGNRQVLALTFSALCVDDASLGTIFSEIANVYSGEQLPEEVLQYADYSEWQNEWLRKDDEGARQAVRLWKQAQFESIPPLSIPFERKNTASTPEYKSVPVRCSLPNRDDLDDFLLSCWRAFLGRINGQKEFALAYLSKGRNHEEFATGIGVFTRPLPLVSSFDSERSLGQFASESAKLRADALEWQDYFPADAIGNHVPVGFALQHNARKRAFNGLAFSEYCRHAASSMFDLQLRCVTDADTHKAVLTYDSAIHSSDYVAELAESFAEFITAASANSSKKISDLSITTAAQREKVITEFNQTAAEFSRTKCIHQLFEEQVELHPNRPALRSGERELSFAQLNQAANQIAHVLRDHGVGPNAPVALCVERSSEMIVALLGVLKSGGCYLPLIPDNPRARLLHQLNETGTPVLLTDSKQLDRLPKFKGKILCLDRDRELFAATPASNPKVEVSPEDRVYVIYTSGSTGVPKGVAVRHFNLVNYSEFICRRLKLQSEPTGLHFATVSTIAADLGNTCIFPSLISGGCLHVIDYETSMSPSAFSEYTSKYPIDVLKITPSHLSTLLNSAEASRVLPRKHLVLGGEAARWNMVARIRELGQCAILNHYGPTEATVGCCTFSVDETDESAWQPATVPIGQPIANDQVYILDSRMQPLPIGVAGELCIGGTGIAEGYLNQPQQTAERFVPDPFSPDPKARIYHTGDLARFLPDGNIEFLGRIDHQVKIRGFRVEPAEVEAVLKRYPAVTHAAIVAYDDSSGEKRLAAYFVGRCRREELRAFLAQELPEYMLPAAFVAMDTLPLNANGKLDVRSLPSPDQVIPEREFIVPTTPDEEKLARIWREVLQLETVGTTDNFFELGGHSLLATQIISRIRNQFRVQMPLQLFLQNPTIGALALEIGNCPAIESEQEEMARLLHELEGISEEEAERLLAAELEKDQN